MSTTYETSLRYALDDRQAAQGLDNLAAKADKASFSFAKLGTAIAGSAAFHEGKKLFIDLNSEMEQLKLSMAAVLTYNLGGAFEDAANKSNRLIAGWQEFSKTTTLTTQQFTQFGSALTGAVTNAGGSLRDLDDVVKKGAVVGQILSAGHAGGLAYVSLELREALAGNVRKTQIFNQQLLGPTMKKLGKEVEDFNKLSSEKRLEIIKMALTDPAWEGAIKQMKSSWLGVTSTLQDNIEIAGREIGLPLFKAMSAEVGKWNQWIAEHPKELEEFGKKFSEYLVEGFRTVKGIMDFIVSHKDLLISMAQIWAVGKMTGIGAGSFAGLGGGAAARAAGAAGAGGITMAPHWGQHDGYSGMTAMTPGSLGRSSREQWASLKGAGSAGMMDLAGGALTGAFLAKAVGADSPFSIAAIGAAGALGRMPGIVGMIGQAVEVLSLGITAAVGWFEKRAKADVNRQGEFSTLLTGSMNTKGLNQATVDEVMRPMWVKIREAGAYKMEGRTVAFDRTKFKSALQSAGFEPEQQEALLTKAFQAMSKGSVLAKEKFFYKGSPEDTDKPHKTTEKVAAVINVNKIEVASEDPDRFAMGLVGAFEKITQRPTQADSVLSGFGG